MIAIFDFDSTLVRLNVDWSTVKKEIIEYAISNHIDFDKFLTIIPLTNMLAPKMKGQIDEIFYKYEFEAVKKQDYVVFQSMMALIKELHKNGIKLAIVSGNCKSTIEKILKNKKVLDKFDIVVGRDQVKLTKPDPEGIIFVLKSMGNNAIYIGDSEVDVAASKKAGIPCFRVIDPEKDPEKIIKLIRNLQNDSHKNQ